MYTCVYIYKYVYIYIYIYKFVVYIDTSIYIYIVFSDTVDGGNPAAISRCFVPLYSDYLQAGLQARSVRCSELGLSNVSSGVKMEVFSWENLL